VLAAVGAAVLALAVASCGSSRGIVANSEVGGSSPAEIGSTDVGTTGGTSSSVGGETKTTHRSGSCTFLLSDGRRFRCPSSFGIGPPNDGLIEHSKACVQLASLVIPASLRATGARLLKVRNYLNARGLNAVGGLVFEAARPIGLHFHVGTSYNPAGELDTSDALIGFYVDPSQAQRAETPVQANVRRSGATLVRDGDETVVWMIKPSQSVRATVQSCVTG
jgi:hypothetical protein